MSGRTKNTFRNPEGKRCEIEIVSKADSCMLTMKSLRDLAEKEAKLVHQALKDMEKNLIDPGYILDLTKSIHISGSKNVSDYINRNTEILLNEYSSVIKQKVIQNMKQQIQDMDSEMSQDSKKLSEDISNFFEYIQSNYEAASASFQKVVELAKNNYEKFEQVREMEEKLFNLRSELQELEQQLLECLMCYAFLSSIKTQEDDIVDKNVFPKEFLESFGPKFADEEFESVQKNVLKNILEEKIIINPIEGNINAIEVMKFIQHFKDSNFSLVQNTELTVWSSATGDSEIQPSQKMKEELRSWEEKITHAEEELLKTKNLYQELQNQIREFNNEDAKKSKLDRDNNTKKITELYKLCTGSDVEFMDIELMKVVINESIEKLFDELDTHPKRKVKELLKVLDAEKKLSERKLEEALRNQRALERLKKTKVSKLL